MAVNFYAQALKRDPKNSYAANGLAIVLAENNHIDQAKDIFTQVREASPDNSSAWINLAHVFVELKQYNHAITMVNNNKYKYKK